MKYAFNFSIFGKEMKTEIEAPNETEAREILLKKVREQVKIKHVRPAKIQEGIDSVNDLFKHLGIWQ